MIGSSYETAVSYSDQTAIEIREPGSLKPLVDRLARAKVVMLGESTHGTQEFYEWRRMISEWLIVKHGFDFIAVEGDWSDASRIHSFIRDPQAAPASARDVLEASERWPSWLWSNGEILRLMEWMKTRGTAGFYGLDFYSLFESVQAVVRYLERVNPLLARRARVRYGCFDRFERDEVAYARSTLTLPDGCEEAVIRNLEECLALRLDRSAHAAGGEALFSAQQNAPIVRDAEKYYRTLVRADESSWNVRDRHMMDTLERLLAKHGPEARGIVWAHNTHIGDYRATPMASQGLVNLGGLARQRLGDEQVALLGFGTYEGTVTASHAWESPVERLAVPPARSDSYEHLFHEVASRRGCGILAWLLDPAASGNPLSEVRGHRAIGVVYDPAHERLSNYVPTSLSRRYDAFFFVDHSQALVPLALSERERYVFPEAYPMGQ